jgi:hypothetical protein
MLRSIFFKNLRTRARKLDHKWTHVKPGWQPVFVRLASHFGGGSLANYCGLVSSARWQLDPLQLPQVSAMKERGALWILTSKK